jgi:hypothetical protein
MPKKINYCLMILTIIASANLYAFSPLYQTELKYQGPTGSGWTGTKIYSDSDGTRWFVKVGGKGGLDPYLIREYVGAALLRHIYGPQIPEIRLLQRSKGLRDGPLATASRELPGFVSYWGAYLDALWNLNFPRLPKAFGEADLKIAMDFIGLGDRNWHNQGYVLIDNERFAARVDFDFSFWFDWFFSIDQNEKGHVDNMMLWLRSGNKDYPLEELQLAVERLIGVPDQVIEDVMENACAELSSTYHTASVTQFCEQESPWLIKALLHRKHALVPFLNELQQIAARGDAF